MKKQNYNNHRIYYLPHHLFFYGFLLALISLSVYECVKAQENKMIWAMFTTILLLLGFLSFMVRQHYALGNQNRIAKTELLFRYYTVTNKNPATLETKLCLSQILALRFAGDDELENLAEKTINENLTADEIKRSIKNWRADNLRV